MDKSGQGEDDGTEKSGAGMRRKENTEVFRVESFTRTSPFCKPPAGPCTPTNTDGRKAE